MVAVKINGVEKQFDTQAAADEAIANAANLAAAATIAKAGTGGTKYRDDARALQFTRQVLDDQLKADKVKAADQTDSLIAGTLLDITEEDFLEAAKRAFRYCQAIQTLNGKHQSPMKGGKLPRDVAKSAIVMVRPASPAAARASALSEVSSVL